MMTILVGLVVVLAAIAIAKLARVYELTSELQDNREEEIALKDHKFNAYMMLGFLIFVMVFFIWQIKEFAPSMLPESASEHGVALDDLLNFNWVIVIAVFVLCNFLLFYFAFKYYYRPDRTAYWFPHSNKLEMLWTIVPAIVLAVIIIYGLKVWNEITGNNEENDMVIELYSKQFDWTARYAGADGTLGTANYNLISSMNPLGLYADGVIEAQAADITSQMDAIKSRLENEVVSDNIAAELDAKWERLLHHKDRVLTMKDMDLIGGADDILIKGEFHIPVGKDILFNFRSQDVIHSAYMPHFRTQMNTVPGMITSFKMKPTITTKEMRVKLEDENFNYMLMCNKVCGAAHFNMKMEIIVETEEEYNAWLKEQKPFVQAKTAVNSTQEVAPNPAIIAASN